MIYPCSCKNEFQDTKYGKGNRLHNPCKSLSKEKDMGIRCTVCGLVKNKPTK